MRYYGIRSATVRCTGENRTSLRVWQCLIVHVNYPFYHLVLVLWMRWDYERWIGRSARDARDLITVRKRIEDEQPVLPARSDRHDGPVTNAGNGPQESGGKD